MSNKIFETIVNRKIENFVSTFVEDSHSIFYDEKLKLIHPGEFGKYRENAIKDLLQILTKYKVSDGFIITSAEKVSTQCDIVIYDNLDFPVLENNFTQFFSIESVIAIGEVKSTLSKTDFENALRKLAENKKLSDDIDGRIKQQLGGKEYERPISFLVCKNVTFNVENIDFKEIYNGFDREYWHNNILIVDQGFWTYNFRFENLVEPQKSFYIENGGNINAECSIETSLFSVKNAMYECRPSYLKIDSNDNFKHIKMFLTAISQAVSRKTLFETQILRYIGLPQIDLYKK